MRRVIPLALGLVTAACLDNGPIRCDDLSTNSCDRPASPRDAVTLRRLRTFTPTHYTEGAPVEVRSVLVTAVDTYDEDMGGSVGDVWVQEVSADVPGQPEAMCPPFPGAPGTRACGMQLFDATLAPTGYHPRVGDLVDISGGIYDEFDCSGVCGTPPQPFPDGHFLPEVSHAVVRSAGVAPVVAPIPVTVAELEGNIDRWIGLLVEVQNLQASAAPDRRGEIQVSGRNGLKITQQLTPIPNVDNGTRWVRVVGIASYFYGPKLHPRSAADLELAR